MGRARKQADVIAERTARQKAAREERGQMVHNAESAGAVTIAAGAVLGLLPEGTSPETIVAVMAALAWVGGAILKFSSENDLPKRVLAKLFPTLLAVVMLTGCVTQIGVSTPMYVGEGEDAVISHEVKGVCFAFWDGSCGANIEAGTGGQDALDAVGDWVDSAARAVGGVLTGAGAAITPAAE